MAETSCKRFFYLLLVLSLAICCTGTVMGSSYDSRIKAATSSILKALSTQDKASPFQFQVLVSDNGVVESLSSTVGSAKICLEKTQYAYLRSYKASWVSGSKTHLRSHIPKLKIPSVIVSCSSFDKGNELQMLLPILRSTKSLLKGLKLEKPIKVAVALPLSLLSSLSMNQMRHLDDVLHFMRETKSFFIVESFVDGEWFKTDVIIQSIMPLSHADVPIVLSIRCSQYNTATDSTPLNRNILRSLYNYPNTVGRLTSILVGVSPTLNLQRRELLNNFNHKSILHDSLLPSTTPVTNPTTPTTIPPYNPTPTIVTIPATNPVSGTPTSPSSVPYTNPVPSTVSGTPTSPSSVPYTNPVPSTTPVYTAPTTPTTDPVAQPVTNPVTTYPPPSIVGGVPSTTPSTTPMTPVTTPVTAPVGTNAPVIPGQTWCIARSGVAETTIQSALDYACGIGGADCSTIQEGASCYNPSTLENHASYAFNSYFQKNPVATSCDFGGAAVLTNTNPSIGTCTFPSSATTASSSTVPPATTASTSGSTGTGTGTGTGMGAGTGTGTGTGTSYGPYSTPPSVLNASSGPTGSSTANGYGNSPFITSPPLGSAGAQAFLGFTTTLIASLAMTLLLGV